MRTVTTLLSILMMTSFVYDVISDNPGTTPHLSEIFVGRCWDYKLIKYKQSMSVDVNCEALWEDFFKAFSFQAPCSLAMENYQEFMEQARQDLPIDKAMFWSGTYVIAHEYAQDSGRYVTLEDTLIGYLANSIVWCGSASDPSGMNSSRCPSWTDCPLEASESFWAAASATFAKSAKGKVTLVLDGSRDGKPAYSRQSFFAKHELPNLDETVEVVILVTHTLGGPVRETCTNGSIVDLTDDIKSRNLVFECLDDPPAIVHLLCADDPEARECRLVKRHLLPGGEKPESDLPSLLNNPPSRFT
ncbi:ADP-ribosyl cyclase/cyclic ADP-ribose hydrolase-like [Haliotis rufescens]|uniref:ADP-ribosyl cyclase/cyclic ADP-ribose hydrolase-like n=1 Tax=Haliotis rufescens TaxID=6454 RepID=UPI00201F0065|nr:ADP-ribosyl cyclase/cyclic ADP-ribose hydrolase-like [Haliotis rufescens]